MRRITEFQGEFRFLSNFFPHPITIDGWTFPSSEHVYQALKSLDPADWKDIQQCVSPGAAKRLGSSLTLRPDWENVKVVFMGEIISVKFQDPELRLKLMATGDAKLIEGNHWGDTFWGVCRGEGKNILGEILMHEREQIRQEILFSINPRKAFST